ncbi:MAG: aldo/keto reductase [Prochloraceae cyanobacterium]
MTRTTTLGPTGITVPSLCIGTWSWGDTLFWKYGKNYGQAEVEKAFEAALSCGLNFFDTAEVYGNGLSEKLLSQFLRKTQSPVQIATKYGPMPWRIWSQSVKEALTASLDRLQLPAVTLYQVHWPFTFFMSQSTLMNALAEEVKQGRIQAVGVSNYSAQQMRQANEILTSRGIPLATNQVRYSLLNRQIESQGILDTARQLGITILAYSPLAQGLLTGKYTADRLPTGPRRFDSRFSPNGLKKIEPVLSLLRQIGEKYERTPAQVALNWLNAQNGVIAIAGVKTASQVQENAGALDWLLSEAEIQQIEQVSRPWLN